MGRSRQTLSSWNQKWRRDNKSDQFLTMIPCEISSIWDWGVGGVGDMSSENDTSITLQPLLGAMTACAGIRWWCWASTFIYASNWSKLYPYPSASTWVGFMGISPPQQTASAHSQELLHLTFIAAQTLAKCIETWSDSDYSLNLTFNSWDTASKNEGSEETFIPSFCFNSLLPLQLALTISTHREKSEVTDPGFLFFTSVNIVACFKVSCLVCTQQIVYQDRK